MSLVIPTPVQNTERKHELAGFLGQFLRAELGTAAPALTDELLERALQAYEHSAPAQLVETHPAQYQVVLMDEKEIDEVGRAVLTHRVLSDVLPSQLPAATTDEQVRQMGSDPVQMVGAIVAERNMLGQQVAGASLIAEMHAELVDALGEMITMLEQAGLKSDKIEAAKNVMARAAQAKDTVSAVRCVVTPQRVLSTLDNVTSAYITTLQHFSRTLDPSVRDLSLKAIEEAVLLLRHIHGEGASDVEAEHVAESLG